MKKRLALLLVAFSFVFFGCKEDAEKKIIGTWVLEMKRADVLKVVMSEDENMTKDVAESMVDLIYSNVSFPAVVYKMVFTETTFETFSVNLRYGSEIPSGSGTYFTEGNTVTLTGGTEPMIGTVRGKKLTFKLGNEELILTKKS